MTERPTLEERDGTVVAVVPAALAGLAADALRLLFRRMARVDGVPPSAALAELATVLARAPLAADLASGCGSDDPPPAEGGPMVTSTEAAAELSVTGRAVRAWAGRGTAGPFPGARRTAGGWLIPTAEVTAHRHRRSQHA